MYAGSDPLTGKQHYLTESTTSEAEARRILPRLLNEVDEQRNARTKATLGAALDAWLRVHEIEATTRRSYEGCIRRLSGPTSPVFR